MKNKKRIYKCKVCPANHLKRSEVVKLPDGCYCKRCHQKRKKEHRDYLLHEVSGVRRKSAIMEEAKKKREISKKQRLQFFPNIKINLPNKKVSALGMWFTKEEKQVLYWKYRNQGMNSEEVNKRLKDSIEFINDIIKDLKKKKISDSEIDKRFKEEFSKLIEQ